MPHPRLQEIENDLLGLRRTATRARASESLARAQSDARAFGQDLRDLAELADAVVQSIAARRVHLKTGNGQPATENG